mmetsp:Transcript_128363/g.286031  ORF Transcript_128363/g.286031 Transcript_128363/m.286031 type:complete len:233 (-) Transcript_128363:697-1395(-)
MRARVVDAYEECPSAVGSAGLRPLRHDEARYSAGGRGRLALPPPLRHGCLSAPGGLLTAFFLRLQRHDAISQSLHRFLMLLLKPSELQLLLVPHVLCLLLPDIDLFFVAGNFSCHLRPVHFRRPLLQGVLVETLHLLLHEVVLLLQVLIALFGIMEAKREHFHLALKLPLLLLQLLDGLELQVPMLYLEGHLVARRAHRLLESLHIGPEFLLLAATPAHDLLRLHEAIAQLL